MLLPFGGGLPNYLQNEIEWIQIRRLRIFGTDKDNLPKLRVSRVVSIKQEAEKIMDYASHPCRKLHRKPSNYQYNFNAIVDYKKARAFPERAPIIFKMVIFTIINRSV